MKKQFLFVLTAVLGCFAGFAQSFDDGLVSSRLSVNTSDTRFTSFVNGFRSGLSRVRNLELTSPESIAAAYNVEVRNYPRLEELLTDGEWAVAPGSYSPSFLGNVKGSLDKLNGQYDNIDQLRNDLAGIAVAAPLSEKEAVALVLMDITVQELKREMAAQLTAKRNAAPAVDAAPTTLTGGIIQPANTVPLAVDEIKIPSWVRCALGVLGGAIVGGLSGAATGMKLGVIFGAHGAAIGGAIGGIAGVIGGAFTGAASYCE